MMVLLVDGKRKQMKPKYPDLCADCEDHCCLVGQTWPSGEIISVGQVEPLSDGRIKGIIIRQCDNPTCINIDKSFVIKEEVAQLLRKVLS